MAFKKLPPRSAVAETPEQMFLDLARRKIPSVLPNQRETMRAYLESGIAEEDVAIQLPTGSGKTLVGLLIGEWRRRKNGERVVYLCPTRQLVHQVAEQAHDKYGLTVVPFVGKRRDYDSASKAAYESCDRIAVTTYNSLFNTNPYFDDADVLIVDDAHAAENYIAESWSVHVSRSDETHAPLHAALRGVLRPLLSAMDFARLSGEVAGLAERGWVEKLATPHLLTVQDQIVEVMDTHTEGLDLRFAWSLLRDHLGACQLYFSTDEILVRPLIAPTWAHAAFCSPKQRIYMSATLGEGGDLERLVGRYPIKRLPVPEGWDRQGVGRRFFMFPEMSLADDNVVRLRQELMRRAGRSLVLVPSDKSRDVIATDVSDNLGFRTFFAANLESSKKPFVSTTKAVAIVANRYDGIDFPGDECRLMFVDGLPSATNLQERFFMSRMGAGILLGERIQTRVLQAIGRCTRSLEDYSAVVVTGDQLRDYLADQRRRRFLHPELQAEIEFGVDQSKEVSVDELIENFDVFLENREGWAEANQQIVDRRNQVRRDEFPAKDELAAAVKQEIAFQKALWQGDYQEACAAAETVLAGLASSPLRGYRALWHYLAGSACWAASNAGVVKLEAKAREHFSHAKKAAVGIPWLVALSRFDSNLADNAETANELLQLQVENLEDVLMNLGTTHDRDFAKREREILSGLASTEKGPFENAHKLLGEVLGYEAGNVESEGAPDPWWLIGDACFVGASGFRVGEGSRIKVQPA